MSTLSTYLQVEDVVLDLEVPDKLHLFREIGRHMERVHGLPFDWVVFGLLRREKAGSTALGEGVAIPHARVRDLGRVCALYLRLSPAISFETPDGKPVTDVLGLMVPGPATEIHLEILADAVSLFSDPAFRETLHRCNDPAQVKEIFDRWTSAPLAIQRDFRHYCYPRRVL
ncbi:PTS sugar transporter subunit IIA [Ottowia thiooxydans]|uniref:PTS system nitrogen regulatory IIA component n=1 Tax=Ottowia thiooxydans TaxID=219182 RepID=A0ABV2Q3Z1_9BURK